MIKIYQGIIGLFSLIILFGFTYKQMSNEHSYKCMVQMTNYNGEGAYVAISILDSNGSYVETVQVFGDDPEWFPELSNWWKANKKNKALTDVDAISGETLSGGKRQIFSISLDNKYLNKGYSMRFETAVEDKAYHASDVIIPLNSTDLKDKVEGAGYIRYVRLIPTK